MLMFVIEIIDNSEDYKFNFSRKMGFVKNNGNVRN